MVDVTDVRKFLDEDGLIDEVNGKEVPFAIYLTAIVESASTNYVLPLSFADVECQAIREGDICLGDIEIWIFADSQFIGWECVECGETGAISNWQGTRWDNRDTTRH